MPARLQRPNCRPRRTGPQARWDLETRSSRPAGGDRKRPRAEPRSDCPDEEVSALALILSTARRQPSGHHEGLRRRWPPVTDRGTHRPNKRRHGHLTAMADPPSSYVAAADTALPDRRSARRGSMSMQPLPPLFLRAPRTVPRAKRHCGLASTGRPEHPHDRGKAGCLRATPNKAGPARPQPPRWLTLRFHPLRK